MSIPKSRLRRGEAPASSKLIAFYIVLHFAYAAPSKDQADQLELAAFTADETGRVFAKPVYGNLIQLEADSLADFASSRGAKGLVFLRKANIESRLNVRFAS